MKQLKPMNKISQEGNAAKNNHISNSGIFFFFNYHSFIFTITHSEL